MLFEFFALIAKIVSGQLLIFQVKQPTLQLPIYHPKSTRQLPICRETNHPHNSQFSRQNKKSRQLPIYRGKPWNFLFINGFYNMGLHDISV